MNIQHINYIDNVCVFAFHFYVNALGINWIYGLVYHQSIALHKHNVTLIACGRFIWSRRYIKD